MGGGGNDDRLAHTHVLLGISHSFVMSYHFLLPQISSCRFCKLELPEPGLTSVVARWGGGLVAVGVAAAAAAAAAVVALAAVAEVAPVGSRIGAVPVAIAVAVAVGVVVVVVVVVVVAAAVAVVAAPIVDIGGVVATGGGLREGTFGCLNSCSYCNIRNQYPKGPSN